jgi:transcriptional regulator with XRE-family HTH domain
MAKANYRLKLFMDALEYTQEELARDIGCHHSLVGYWIRGRYKPSSKYLPKLCDRLGVEPEMILEG